MKAHSVFRQLVESCLCLVALLLLSPVLLVIASWIAIETGRPIVFSQTRVGRSGVPFRLLKFRTMRQNNSSPSLTVSGDRRVTAVGRVLRKFKLDELPQLLNIVRGDMSIVGPRPEVPEFVNLHEPAWRSVLRVRPGITDPASIAFHQEERLLAQASDPIRYYRESLLPTKMAMNIEYIRDRSWWLDLQVILRTVQCAMFPGKLQL
jgi:lipopolysaccharide/colanic/teichoic acid biosynthesis glycosyltransferase